MHEIHLYQRDKAARYRELIPQIRSLMEGETDMTANLANVSAALKEAFGFLWVGFYMVGGMYPYCLWPWGVRYGLERGEEYHSR